MTSRQWAWSQRMKAERRCVTCGQPAVTRQHCAKHREYHNARRRKTGWPECTICGRTIWPEAVSATWWHVEGCTAVAS